MTADIDPRTRLSALADQCVKCGLCLPACPTYRIGRDEAESPRGRIALAQALAAGTLPVSPSLSTHIDQCLACMSCESVCPAHVRYGELIVTTRSLLRASNRASRSWLDFMLRRPRLMVAGLRIANLPLLGSLVRSRIVQALARPFGLDRLLREMPRLPERFNVANSGKESSRGRVGLFLGCAASLVDRDVHAAAKHLLTALGYEVAEPRGFACCGALALHAGDLEGAERIGERAREALAGVETVLVSASGCFGALRDHVFADSGVRVRDVHEFIAADERFAGLRFDALPLRIALHTPCTQANVVRAGASIRALLARIPQLEIVDLPQEPRCCGAAGDYFLRHGHIADALRAQKLAQVRESRGNLLVTSNVGCRAFLDNGLRQRSESVEVTHPIVLLARQLQN